MPPHEKFDPPSPKCLTKPDPPTVSSSGCCERQPEASRVQPRVLIEKREGKDMDFDELLPHIGEFGFYQKILFVLMIPFAFFVAWVYFSQIFITLVPEGHWCRIPELDNLTIEQKLALAIPLVNDGIDSSNFIYSKCSMYNINYTKILENGTIHMADPSWPVQKCQYGWEFNFTDLPYQTIATELEWVCDKAALPTLAQSIFFVGAIFGGLIFGWIADKYGRIPALVGTNVAGFIAGVMTAFTTNFWQFAACRFLVGLAFDNCFTMMYILVLEYVGPKWRTFVANMSIALFFTFASSILPWIAYFIADWRWTCIATSVPLVLAVATPWLVQYWSSICCRIIANRCESSGCSIDSHNGIRSEYRCTIRCLSRCCFTNFATFSAWNTRYPRWWIVIVFARNFGQGFTSNSSGWRGIWKGSGYLGYALFHEVSFLIRAFHFFSFESLNDCEEIKHWFELLLHRSLLILSPFQS